MEKERRKKKFLYLRHRFRRDLASQQKHNTRIFLVGGKDPSWVNLLSTINTYTPENQTDFYLVYICFSPCLAFFLHKRKEIKRGGGKRESILWRHLSRFTNPGNAALVIPVTPSPGSHTALGKIVGQPFSPFCNFPGCCCCCCCCCSGVGASAVPGTKSTFSIDEARVCAPRKTAFAVGTLIFCSELGQISSA